jgi:hypothetical protein
MAERCGRSAERTRQCELGTADAVRQTQLRLRGKGETLLGFRLYLGEWSARRQAERGRRVPAVASEGEVADAIHGVQCPAHQLLPAGRVLRPRHHEGTHAQVGSSLVTRKSALLDDVVSELAEAISSP